MTTRSRRTHARRIRRRRLTALAAACFIVAAATASLVINWGPSPAARSVGEAQSPGNARPSTDVPLPPITAPTTSSVSGSSTTAASTTSLSVSADAPVPAAPIVRRGPTDKKWIALTFDDNYQGANATKTIAALKASDVPATFFVIGHYVDLGPKLAREIAAAGFEVGDHTRSHADCSSLSKRALRIEIGNGTDHYRELTGAPTIALFRPPGGFIDQKTCEVAAEKGFKYVVMWDVDTNDWRGRTAAQIVDTVMGNAHNGAIVLMHMAGKHTAEAIPVIASRLRGEGYELVTLSKMLGL